MQYIECIHVIYKMMTYCNLFTGFLIVSNSALYANCHFSTVFNRYASSFGFILLINRMLILNYYITLQYVYIHLLSLTPEYSSFMYVSFNKKEG